MPSHIGMHFAGYWRITTVIEFWLSCLLNRYAGFTTGRPEMVFSSTSNLRHDGPVSVSPESAQTPGPCLDTRLHRLNAACLLSLLRCDASRFEHVSELSQRSPAPHANQKRHRQPVRAVDDEDG